MASTVTPTPGPSSEPTVDERRPQAGPLPRKRGEIGYQEEMDVGTENEDGSDRNTDSAAVLPVRHPADREPTPPPEASNPGPPDTNSESDASSLHTLHKPSRQSPFLSWLGLLNRKRIGGVKLATIIRLTLQLLLLAGTITLWVVVTKLLAHGSSGNASASGSQDAPPSPALGGSAGIFVHVSFSIVTLAQLLLLERCIFFIRAQRYAYNHPGAALPTHSRGARAGPATGMAFAPWNRPPLPTYAAALAQSGVGTGDVEDNIIAIPPPPAYGHTRGSTLLLAGFMRNSLRAAVAQNSQGTSRPASHLRASHASHASRLSRPVSYRSHDEEWEERCDAERALYLAETLERLENTAQPSTVPERVRRS
ncbi:uncharacterized protein FOMMEDRAFT_170744 [Fomitiporia mediterranea MF3/22]|uniref:uncharacterized protein n=1 Tax=Fomitiporia mediterranea (strain MF3/22) TaxID=694068 RepID=UPI000440896D|nr:uncharacterized protein FOMMEDRAFT_170744 [Fomitiporia mediterranea MF3/22]EJC98950.1 hypothetical protein FOMMEDRAFT_170744 [Fomitiporia mediterranea MF3/22]